MDDQWPTVSPRIRDLIRRGAELILDPPDGWVEQLHDASLGGIRMKEVADDPVLAEGTRQTNLANTLQWLTYSVAHPGERVPVHISPEILSATRDLVRRGLDESSLDAFRTAQSVAWRLWMEVSFSLTQDPAELRELLSVTSLSISTFIDDTVAAMTERMRIERTELTRGTDAERREAVALVLEGAPIPPGRAETQLRYRLSGPHTALVVWTGAAGANAYLEPAAEMIARSSGSSGRLTVVASAAAWWLWLPTAAVDVFDLSAYPEIRVSVGRPGEGIEGFRTSHFQALAAQRLHTRLAIPRQVVQFDEIRLVSLLTADADAGQEFLTDTLGALVDADAELVETVRVWISLQCNTSHTATALYIHRNTVIRRLERADELLPRPLAEHLVDVAAALEMLRWRR